MATHNEASRGDDEDDDHWEFNLESRYPVYCLPIDPIRQLLWPIEPTAAASERKALDSPTSNATTNQLVKEIAKR